MHIRERVSGWMSVRGHFVSIGRIKVIDMPIHIDPYVVCYPVMHSQIWRGQKGKAENTTKDNIVRNEALCNGAGSTDLPD